MHYLYSALKSYDTEALEKRRQYNELGRASKTHNDNVDRDLDFWPFRSRAAWQSFCSTVSPNLMIAY